MVKKDNTDKRRNRTPRLDDSYVGQINQIGVEVESGTIKRSEALDVLAETRDKILADADRVGRQGYIVTICERLGIGSIPELAEVLGVSVKIIYVYLGKDGEDRITDGVIERLFALELFSDMMDRD